MQEDVKLSRLISRIYDASLDPTLWLDVLEQAANFVGGPAASLYSRDATSRGASAAYQFGLDPRYVRLYLEKYAKLDPTTAGYFFAKIDEPVDVQDVMPYSEFLESRFYKEWAHPQGWVDSTNVVLDKSPQRLPCSLSFAISATVWSIKKRAAACDSLHRIFAAPC